MLLPWRIFMDGGGKLCYNRHRREAMEDMMKYKAVLFDMDGTVLDTLSDLTDAMNHTLREFGMPEITRERAAAALGNGAARYLAGAVPEGTPEELQREMLSVYAPWYDAHCQIKTAPYRGIPELLARLKAAGVGLAVISNKQDTAVRQLAAEHFAGLMDFAVGESAAVRRKPNPDAVLSAMRELGAERAECIYVGDTEVDLATAVNAGIDCAAVTWGFRTREQLITAGATRLFDTAETLGDYLLSMA